MYFIDWIHLDSNWVLISVGVCYIAPLSINFNNHVTLLYHIIKSSSVLLKITHVCHTKSYTQICSFAKCQFGFNQDVLHKWKDKLWYIQTKGIIVQHQKNICTFKPGKDIKETMHIDKWKAQSGNYTGDSSASCAGKENTVKIVGSDCQCLSEVIGRDECTEHRIFKAVDILCTVLQWCICLSSYNFWNPQNVQNQEWILR